MVRIPDNPGLDCIKINFIKGNVQCSCTGYDECSCAFTDSENEDAEFDIGSSEENSCPSDECWTFDGSKCTLQPGCTELKCGATSISIGIMNEVFGHSDTNHAISTTPELSTIDEFGYRLQCNLGECGMEYEVAQAEDGTNKLAFKVKISQNEINKINLGDVSVSLSKAEIELEFVCLYNIDVTIASNEYTIEDAVISGTTTGTGSLAAGFSLTITSDSNFALGTMLNVAASWELSFPEVSFSFE